MTDLKTVPVPNADTQTFWDACNEDRLLFQTCKDCGHTQFYPRVVCVSCESRDLKWHDSAKLGTVHSYTIVQRAPSPAFKADAPYLLALIDLDEGFRMMVNILNCPTYAASIGMKVHIIFEDREGQKVPQAAPLN
jgi:uncharacterized protein